MLLPQRLGLEEITDAKEGIPRGAIIMRMDETFAYSKDMTQNTVVLVKRITHADFFREVSLGIQPWQLGLFLTQPMRSYGQRRA